MGDVILAREVKVGDLIDGPDGHSTVTDIRLDGNAFHFSFAEGRGNRCVTVFASDTVLRYERARTHLPQGFVVDTRGLVVESGVAVVEDQGEQFEITDVDGCIMYHRKENVRHICGTFVFVPRQETSK